MLSSDSKTVIRATLPVVGAAIEEITTVFYSTLFRDDPSLERDLFNRSNQAQGDQQRALAGAIASFATVLVADDAPSPDAILSRIANKHASLGITEDRYGLVHDHLFGAIVEVLGEAVTPEVASAWDEVYWLMANGLIAVERELYARANVEPGQVWRTVRVSSRVQESPDCIALSLESAGPDDLPDFLPGQYISVAVVLPDGARQIRQYSVTRPFPAPSWVKERRRLLRRRPEPASEPMRWRITVKKVEPVPAVPEQQAVPNVSNVIHANVFEGDELTVSLPFGSLTLDRNADPVLLISAGIGCTPMIGMLHHLVDTQDPRPVSVIHADSSPADQPHRAELTELVGRLPTAIMQNWYEDLGLRSPSDVMRAGRADLADIPLADGVRAYLCGPLGFMQSMREQLIDRGVPGTSIHYEVFGPDLWLQA
ncbi:MAG: globin domain-containing protein [Rhodococcus sp. (in: high G+C Gram-positive bacteria)]|uniref:globin domain-containing protein n=1 Tax=Rhodococcus sp. TaxID=1831 RepID=UPI003BB10ED0